MGVWDEVVLMLLRSCASCPQDSSISRSTEPADSRWERMTDARLRSVSSRRQKALIMLDVSARMTRNRAALMTNIKAHIDTRVRERTQSRFATAPEDPDFDQNRVSNKTSEISCSMIAAWDSYDTARALLLRSSRTQRCPPKLYSHIGHTTIVAVA